MATRKGRNIYFPQYFMDVRKFTNIYIPKYFCTSVSINGRFYVYTLCHVPLVVHKKKLRTESFNIWGGGRGCNKFFPVLGGDGTKIAPPGDLFDQPPGEMK